MVSQEKAIRSLYRYVVASFNTKIPASSTASLIISHDDFWRLANIFVYPPPSVQATAFSFDVYQRVGASDWYWAACSTGSMNTTAAASLIQADPDNSELDKDTSVVVKIKNKCSASYTFKVKAIYNPL